ncbi:MAG: hypothetical protein H7210_04710 [Pyrinomonadaceae bacterium]|nr:hypothetical protein [Phycisphaerales bacterium]
MFARQISPRVPFMTRGLLRSLAGLACTAAVALAPSPAAAQLNLFRGMEFRPAVSTRELDRYGKLFKLSEQQLEASKELLASYTSEFEQLSKERRDKMKDISDEFQETRDFSVMEQMGPVMEKYSKKATELETTFLDDFKVLLKDDQAAVWPKFERTRRREKTIDQGTLSGESVDLVKVVDDLNLSEEARLPLVDAMEQYEVDLDRVLAERNKVAKDQQEIMSPKPGSGGAISLDMTAMEEAMQKVQEAGGKVRDVNQRYARTFEGLVPEASLVKFKMAVKQQTFPQVYRPSRTAKAIEAAEKFEDLDARQKEEIKAIREQYDLDLQAANDRWAAALAEEEKSGSGPKGFGGLIMSFGDEKQEGPVPDARKAKRELDKRMLDSLKNLLTDAQKEKLPKRDETEGGPGSGVMTGGASIRINR